jgi:RNA-directed DNA polymerase
MHRYVKAFRKYDWTVGMARLWSHTLTISWSSVGTVHRQSSRQPGVGWPSIGLTLNETKTRVCDARCESFTFLGYTFGPMYSPRTGGRYIGARPSNAAIARIKARIRQHLRSGNQAPWQEVAAPLNRTVRGWATYFTYGSVTKARSGVQRYLYATVRRLLCRRHKVKGGGYRQFSDTRVCGELGVFSFAAPSR